MSKKKYSILSVASLAFSSIGIVCLLLLIIFSLSITFPVYILTTILVLALFLLAIIFGFVGLDEIKNERRLKGRALSLWGIVLGFVGVLLILIMHLFLSWVKYTGYYSIW